MPAVADQAFGILRERLPVLGSRGLGANVAGVEGAGDGRVFRAFDNGAAIGEDCELVGGDAEADEEVVVADFVGGGGAEAAAEFGEIEAAVAFVNLDGIASA